MKTLKYVIYVLAAIAAPLWLALGNFGAKQDSNSKSTLSDSSINALTKAINEATKKIGNEPQKLELDTVAIHELSKTIMKDDQNNSSSDSKNLKDLIAVLEKQNREQKPTQININGENFKPLFEIIKASIDANAKKEVTVKLDPISINLNNDKPKDLSISKDEIYYLGENDLYPIWKIDCRININENIKRLIVLSNSSKEHSIVIDTITSSTCAYNPQYSKKDTINPQNQYRLDKIIDPEKTNCNCEIHVKGWFLKRKCFFKKVATKRFSPFDITIVFN